MAFLPTFANGQPVATGLNNVVIVGSIGFFILLLAIINFVNLVTARASVKSQRNRRAQVHWLYPPGNPSNGLCRTRAFGVWGGFFGTVASAIRLGLVEQRDPKKHW
jgi:hypothetical protein